MADQAEKLRQICGDLAHREIDLNDDIDAAYELEGDERIQKIRDALCKHALASQEVRANLTLVASSFEKLQWTLREIIRKLQEVSDG